MLKILGLLSNVLKSDSVGEVVKSILENVGSDSETAETKSVESVVTTWTDAELAAAEAEWAKGVTDATVETAFAAGARWAVSHQVSKINDKIAEVVSDHTKASESVVKEALGDAASIAADVVSGNVAGAVVEAVKDAETVVKDYKEEKAEAKADDSAAPAAATEAKADDSAAAAPAAATETKADETKSA